MKREYVYAMVDSEMDYQDRKWGSPSHSPEEFIVYMEDYLAEAKHLLSRNSMADVRGEVMSTIRKVTALGVVCMEQWGVTPRL